MVNQPENNYPGIGKSFDKNIKRINLLLDSGFKTEAIIIIVTTCETFFEDLIKTSRAVWFGKPPCVPISALDINIQVPIKIKIKDYLEKLKIFDKYLKQYYVYKGCHGTSIEGLSNTGDSDADTLYHILFIQNGQGIINFQNLKDKTGAKEAFKFFLGVDLLSVLSAKENESHRNWESLNRLFEERHKIIHSGENTKYSEDEIRDIIGFLEFMKSKLISEVENKYNIPT